MNSLTELVEKSNIVTVHVDYNSDIITCLTLMYFRTLREVSTSRGSLVDEHALLASLKEKRISVPP